MTRFARAKGSKASNERLPEDATSWSEMKQQLLHKNKDIEEAKKREEFLDQRLANYKSFLNEKAQENMKSEWSVFTSDSKDKHNKTGKNAKPRKNDNILLKKSSENDEVSSSDETYQDLKSKLDKVLNDTKFNEDAGSENDAPPEEESSKKEINLLKVEAKKIKKKKLKILVDKEAATNGELNKNEDRAKKIGTEISKNNQVKTVKRKRKNVENERSEKKMKTDQLIGEEQEAGQEKITKVKKLKKTTKSSKLSSSNPSKKKSPEELSEKDLKKIEKKKQKRIKQLEKKKKSKEESKQKKLEEEQKNQEAKKTSTDNRPETTKKTNSQNTRSPKKIGSFEKPNVEKAKIKNKNEHKRKKPLLPHKMFINGKELEIDYVDGFPVKKEDAIRLKKLRKEMISKGLPGSEIKISLKLERRKAEKAFAREKKKVCFNCRKSGHNLSECPELGKGELAQTQGSGICFKCGSTEHTHFECKVVRGQEFKYAQCFICNEQGHISRQCPDNARGLYPKGGSCNVCGDVTHLKKDCPKYQTQQQQFQNSLSVDIIGSDNPDILQDKSTKVNFSGNSRQNKIIKF